mmetsp:Transcript_3305/g.11972  ORF Transcript_3305/g.11972 Transcript_3305/m.11972 type:complete len:212 (-) Transcript_3305:174-809(-)
MSSSTARTAFRSSCLRMVISVSTRLVASLWTPSLVMLTRYFCRSSISRVSISTLCVAKSAGPELGALGSGSPRRRRQTAFTRARSLAWAAAFEGSAPPACVISAGRALPPPHSQRSWSRAFSSSVETGLQTAGRKPSVCSLVSATKASMSRLGLRWGTRSMALYSRGGATRRGTATSLTIRVFARGSAEPIFAPPGMNAGGCVEGFVRSCG